MIKNETLMICKIYKMNMKMISVLREAKGEKHLEYMGRVIVAEIKSLSEIRKHV